MDNIDSLSLFRFIDPYSEISHTGDQLNEMAVTSPRTANTARTVEGLCQSAMQLFRGAHPWQTFRLLPWHSNYYESLNGYLLEKPLNRESIEEVAKELAALLEIDATWGATYRSETLRGSPKTIIQSLCVETLLHLDKVIDYLIKGEPYKAMDSLTYAHGALFHATAEVQKWSGIGFRLKRWLARVAADARQSAARTAMAKPGGSATRLSDGKRRPEVCE